MKALVWAALVCAPMAFAPLAFTPLSLMAQPATPRQPGTIWTDSQLLKAVAPVRAGRKLTPKVWPNNARVAVCLSFDDDNESYPSSFFIPAVSALLHPEMIPAIMKSGRHEIGVHGWIHEFPPSLGSAAEEERLLTKAIDYLTTATGKRPVGYRAPSWAFSTNTLGLIRKAGMLYDSSLQSMDEPYEIMSNGEATGLVELGIDWTLTETPYLGRGGTMPSPEALFKLFRDEFDGAYEQRTMFVLTLHPHVAGHRAPMKQLELLIQYMKTKPGVWFATTEQIARYVKAQDALVKR